MNNNNDNVYRLYKLIFNNKYICNLIFNNIRKLNNQKRKSNLIKKSMKYNEPTFEWMVANGHYELIIDRIKHVKLKSNLTRFTSIEPFLKYIQNNGDQDQMKLILDKFYKLNRQSLIEIYSIYPNEEQPMFYLQEVISSKCLMFIQVVHENERQQQTTQNKSSDQDYKLLDLSLRNGNLEIVKYLHEQLGIQFNSSTTLFNSLLSDNRNCIVEYLLQNKPNPPILKEYSNYTQDNIRFHFNGLLKLNSHLFSKLVNEFKVPFQFDMTSKEIESSIHSNFYTFHMYDCNVNGNTYDKIINIQPIFESLRNSFYILSNTKFYRSRFKIQFNSSLLLYKINHLLKYNENQDDMEEIKNYKLGLEQFKYQQLNKYSQCIDEPITIFGKSNSSGVISSFLKLLSKELSSSPNPIEQPIQTKTTSESNLLNTNCSEIDYSNFNLSKEIERIIIFDYLLLISQYGCIGFKNLMNMVFNFANKYNEYDKIASIKEIGLKECRDSSDISFCEYLVNKAIKLSDCKLIQLLPTLISDPERYNLVLKEQKSGRLEVTDKIDTINSIDNQIQFIITSFKMNIFSNIQKETKILSRLFFNNQFNSIDQFIEIAEYALKPYSASHLISCEWLTRNRLSFIYYHENYKSLFSNWDNSNIARTIIEIGDLQLIQYVYDNGLCGFNQHYCQQQSNNQNGNLIKFSLNRQVAEYLFKLGYNRISSNVFNFSFFSEFESNYLFRWAVKRLIRSHEFESLKLENLNIYQTKFINSLVNNGELDINKLQIIITK